MNSAYGKVYLVGAGPGDPGLITVKGRECIEKADVLIYDYLAAPSHLAYAKKNAEIIYVGKKGGDHTLSQDGINALLVEKAKTGAIVTRLKGGDPFIFGRGGEEAEVLIEEGIDWEVVPGVTSAIAATAYAGIPLTHRKFTATLSFVTGHEDPNKESSTIDWEAISKSGTIVFYMGVRNLPNIVEKLSQCGKPAHTPVALVRWGTTTKQETVAGTLETIVDDVRKAGLKSPSIIVVGDVVSLRDTMKWFEDRPLFGKRIVITRARKQASGLTSKLMELGAECIEAPAIEIKPIDNSEAVENALSTLSNYDWVIFTSVNGVTTFFDRLFEKGLDARALGGLKTACIGPSTAAELKKYGIGTDILPESYVAESVVEAFKNEAMDGAKVLLPRAQEARPVIPVELTKMGAKVNEVAVYRTEFDDTSREKVAEALSNGKVDMVTFTSSSTVKNFVGMIPGGDLSLLENVTVASIGPVTEETAKELGLTSHITADSYTIDGLVDAIVNASS
ncbi:MAG: uroporphyrinogen-III C-methyltransferase [Desulfobacterales bacterium]|nr:uroporphyrinogen-III C-methyltransferase [Desulfobacterales bacterium]